jgi:hypothetical protein
MRWFQSKYLEGVRAHGKQGVSFLLGAADEAAKDSPLWQAMLKDAADEATQANRAATGAFWTGLASKVLKRANPLIAVASAVYEVHSGYSARRAAFTTISGAAGGGLAMGGLAFGAGLLGATPPGWLLIGFGAVVGVFVGQFAAPALYDEHVASARERLLHTPQAPDLDPDPSRLRD